MSLKLKWHIDENNGIFEWSSLTKEDEEEAKQIDRQTKDKAI